MFVPACFDSTASSVDAKVFGSLDWLSAAPVAMLGLFISTESGSATELAEVVVAELAEVELAPVVVVVVVACEVETDVLVVVVGAEDGSVVAKSDGRTGEGVSMTVGCTGDPSGAPA